MTPPDNPPHESRPLASGRMRGMLSGVSETVEEVPLKSGRVVRVRHFTGTLRPEDVEGLEGAAFPFPLAEPTPEPVMITRPCGCTSMVVDEDAPPTQVSWCVEHDPGYPQP